MNCIIFLHACDSNRQVVVGVLQAVADERLAEGGGRGARHRTVIDPGGASWTRLRAAQRSWKYKLL
jgi:hypothetical protein